MTSNSSQMFPPDEQAFVGSTQVERNDRVTSSNVFVTPRPEKSVKETNTAIAELIDFLGLSGSDSVAVAEFLDKEGYASVEDVVFIKEEDFEKQSVGFSKVAQRKLLSVTEFVRLGGSLDSVDSITSLVQRVHLAGTTPNKPFLCSKEPDPVVNLDVGGCKFTTTRKTLCSVRGSFFESMFSGRHENAANHSKDGDFVVDRPGKHFGYILDFLRVGTVVSLPKDKAAREELSVEADFYGLDVLVRAIQQPGLDVDEYLPDQVRSIRQEEMQLREAFRTNTAQGLDPHQGLVSLFSPDSKDVDSLPLKYEPLVETKGLVLMMDVYKRAPPGTPVTVSSIERFRTNFNREHADVLHRLAGILLEEPVILAGGSVLRALTTGVENLRKNSWSEEGKGDVDIFICCTDRQEANRIARRIFFSLAVDGERWVCLRSKGVVHIHRWMGERWADKVDQKIQIVLRLYDSPSEVLLGFDCDCCCAYDGRAVWVSRRWIHSLRKGVNFLNPLHSWPNKPSYELRLTKYAYRGFPVVVPGLDGRCFLDSSVRHGKNLRELKGMARLVKASFVAEANTCYDEAIRSLDVERGKNAAQQLVSGFGGYADGVGFDVIVPRVYCSGNPSGYMWWGDAADFADFPSMSSALRTRAWTDIAETSRGASVDGVPDHLVDSWETKKQSREYLNGTMDPCDLSSIYYSHAYNFEPTEED